MWSESRSPAAAASWRNNLNPFAQRSAGAQGIAQFMLGMAAGLGHGDRSTPSEPVIGGRGAALMVRLVE
jgi:hypothetical protein